MLPIVLYNNMEGSSSGNLNLNSSFGQYDDNVILNCVRNRKKVTELPNCPVCSCTIRQGELESHIALEIERLQKLSSGGSKRKLSATSSLALPGPSTSPDMDISDDQEVDVTGCPGSDVYQRIHGNRLRRLRARRRASPPPIAQDGECPVCNATLPVARLQRHALRCLKRTGAAVDDLSDSEEDGTIDVEGDEPASFAEYQWCGEWRVRATALQDSEARPGTCVRRASHDQALVVDGDEDTELYGPPQYSPSRIADAEVTQETDEPSETPDSNPADEKKEIETPKPNGLVEASAETRIQALKAKIKELEQKQNGGAEAKSGKHREETSSLVASMGLQPVTYGMLTSAKSGHVPNAKCLICLGAYVSPAVSIQCWHVYCEGCWLQSLNAKKICPQCNAITSAQQLRRIYM